MKRPAPDRSSFQTDRRFVGSPCRACSAKDTNGARVPGRCKRRARGNRFLPRRDGPDRRVQRRAPGTPPAPGCGCGRSTALFGTARLRQDARALVGNGRVGDSPAGRGPSRRDSALFAGSASPILEGATVTEDGRGRCRLQTGPTGRKTVGGPARIARGVAVAIAEEGEVMVRRQSQSSPPKLAFDEGAQGRRSTATATTHRGTFGEARRTRAS